VNALSSDHYDETWRQLEDFSATTRVRRTADVVNDEIPGPYDAVVCSELLEHLDDPARALERIAPALKPRGTIVVTVPNGKVFATERAAGHVRHPTLAMVHEWFDAAGLDVVEASPQCPSYAQSCRAQLPAMGPTPIA
jgi:2-polyprenyl-3-methyl-5-hydroxy-6-metoxy-1,4-benzoquinol methylase